MHYDVVIFGNYTKDTIVSPAGTRYVDGGGFNYGAHVCAMMGLNTAAVKSLSPDMRARNAETGTTIIGDTPEEFSAVIKADIARLTKLIKEANIRE